MKTAVALLALLTLAVLSVVPLQVDAFTSNTWVNNLSSKGITASITYDFNGNPKFINREVPAGQDDHDEYDGDTCDMAMYYANDPTPINIEIWQDTSSSHQTMKVQCDFSIVALDIAGTDEVAIYVSVYGNINQPDGQWILALTP